VPGEQRKTSPPAYRAAPDGLIPMLLPFCVWASITFPGVSGTVGNRRVGKCNCRPTASYTSRSRRIPRRSRPHSRSARPSHGILPHGISGTCWGIAIGASVETSSSKWRRWASSRCRRRRARPWQRAYVERVIGTIRRECLDQMIVYNERSLYRHLKSFVEYYHRSRSHLALEKDAPEPRPIQKQECGPIVSLPVLAGLHHRYQRRAA